MPLPHLENLFEERGKLLVRRDAAFDKVEHVASRFRIDQQKYKIDATSDEELGETSANKQGVKASHEVNNREAYRNPVV